MIRRTISVDKEIWNMAKKKAKEKNTSLSAIIRALVKMWVLEKIEITL